SQGTNMNLEKGEQLLVMAVLATSAACACPPAPAPAGASAPRHEPRPPVHAEGAHHPGHGGAHGPLVHEFKEGPEHWRKRFEEPGRDASQKPAEVVKAMGLAPGMAVADVGAGTGYFMRHLALAVGETGRV